jgi:hypothetical protein
VTPASPQGSLIIESKDEELHRKGKNVEVDASEGLEPLPRAPENVFLLRNKEVRMDSTCSVDHFNCGSF